MSLGRDALLLRAGSSWKGMARVSPLENFRVPRLSSHKAPGTSAASEGFLRTGGERGHKTQHEHHPTDERLEYVTTSGKPERARKQVEKDDQQDRHGAESYPRGEVCIDARKGYTEGMTQREPGGGALVRADAYVQISSEEQRRHGYSLDDQEREPRIQMGSRGWKLVDARDLPYLSEKTPPVRDHEIVPEEKTDGNSLGLYYLTQEIVHHLHEEEFARRRRQASNERTAKYRAMYDDLDLSEVAHPDGTLKASWRFGAAELRNGSEKSKNRHATGHVHPTEHPLIRSFQPGEDWVWCYVGKVVMEPNG